MESQLIGKMLVKIKVLTLSLVLTSLLYAAASEAASIVGSKHDLASGIRTETCVFCHTPHFANSAESAPLWNKNIANDNRVFTRYSSDTIGTSIPNRPSGISLACLSCHDGVSPEVHSVINQPGSSLGTATYAGTCDKCHSSHGSMGRTMTSQLLKLGPDLSNDHPISMVYPTDQQDPGFHIPPDLQKGWSDVPLFRGKVECPSCHNVHDPARVPFLRMANSGSTLCYKCHNK
jgi:predicted CXXCH cytochrome family protein